MTKLELAGIGATTQPDAPPAPRSLALDSARFCLAALVPICHLLENAHGNSAAAAAAAAYRWILLFNMPAFALLSGAVTAPRACTAMRVLTSLVFPYLLFQTLYCLFDAGAFGTGRWVPHYVVPYWLLWYLVSLACWRLAAPLALRTRWPLAFAVIAAIAAGFFNDIGNAFSLSRTLVFFPFFLWGLQLGPTRIDALVKRRGAIPLATAMLAVSAAAAWHWRTLDPAWLYHAVSYETLRASPLAGAARRLWIIAGAAGCSLAAIVLAGRTAPWFHGAIARIGQRSMTPFLLRGFLIRGAIAAGVFPWVVANLPAPWLLPLWTVVGVLITLVLSLPVVTRLMTPLLNPAWLTRCLFVEDEDAGDAPRTTGWRHRIAGFKRLY